ncbi:MAG: response regulator [Candidatus Paceibacterota bacterium]
MPKKVLIIEDEEILSKLLKNKLQDEGYEAEVALDGQEGLAKAKSFKPDLILLDIIMPKVNGFEVLEKIKVDSELNKIPIIIVSNSGQPVELERAQKLGAVDWLVKTEFDPEEVIDKVIRQIGKV